MSMFTLMVPRKTHTGNSRMAGAALIARHPSTVEDVSEWVRENHQRNGHATWSEIAANAARTLIVVAYSLLDRQIRAQARAFEREGGFTERMYPVHSVHKTHLK